MADVEQTLDTHKEIAVSHEEIKLQLTEQKVQQTLQLIQLGFAPCLCLLIAHLVLRSSKSC